MFRTRGLTHLHLRVLDVERTIRFYGELFGFEVISSRGDVALLQTPLGQGKLSIERADTVEPTSFGLALCDRSERGAAARLAVAHGGVVVEWTDHRLGGTTAVIADPSGHRITL
jgi:predicted enzyme related to lactoylglutathione lyase